MYIARKSLELKHHLAGHHEIKESAHIYYIIYMHIHIYIYVYIYM